MFRRKKVPRWVRMPLPTCLAAAAPPSPCHTVATPVALGGRLRRAGPGGGVRPAAAAGDGDGAAGHRDGVGGALRLCDPRDRLPGVGILFFW